MALLELTLGGSVYKFSDSPVASSSQGMYLPRILSWGSLDYSATDRTAALQAPELTVDIADPPATAAFGGFAPLFFGATARTIRGSSAVIYLAYDDIVFADWFKIFDGQVGSASIISSHVWRFRLRFNDAAIASAISQLYIQTLDADTFPTAPEESLGTEIPIIYGKNTFSGGGILGVPRCSTDGDPVSATAPYRYVVQSGFATKVGTIYKDGVFAANPVKDTGWFWTIRNGLAFTEVGLVSDEDVVVSVDVWGLSDNGEGSIVEADLITNPAKQIEHLLTNFIFNRWRSGAYFSAASQPIDTASITTVESYFDKVRGSTVKKTGSNILRRQSALSALNDWAFQNQVAAWWNVDGKLRFAIRDPFDTDVYLDNNTPANWPWFESDVHGRGQNAIFPYAEDDQQVADRITGRLDYVDLGSRFLVDRIVQDFNRALVSEEEMELRWADSDTSTVGATDFDVVSRRFRRYRFPPRVLSANSSIALLDPNLFEGVLVSDPDVTVDVDLEWGKENIWQPRLFSLTSQNINLNTKTVQLRLEDERDYRCTLWHTGRGEVTQTNRGRGMPILYQVTNTFTRATKAWVPNIDGKIVRLANNIPKLTTDGWLLEAASDNWIKNPAFVAGLTDWTTFNTVALDTTALIFEPETAADLSGTNQTVKISSVAAVAGILQQTTARTFAATIKGSFSILYRDNTASQPIRVFIQNTSTTNWLNTAGNWQGSKAKASNFTYSGDWVRRSIKFQMENPGATLLIEVQSAATTTADHHVGHVQIEDSAAFPTSIMVSGSGSTFTRNRDQNVFGNSTAARCFKWYEQGTFRCTYQPLFNAADLATSAKPTIFEVLNSTPTSLLKMLYEENSGTARFNFAHDFTGGDSAVATITHDVVAGQVYKIVGTWIGANSEFNRGQGSLWLWVYDPIGATWLDASGGGTQNASVASSTFRIGDGVATPFTAYGHIAEFEVLPFVLGQNEIKAFP